MNRIEDYKQFINEKSELINKLKEHKTLLYDLFHPILLVLDYLTGNDINIEGYKRSELEEVFNDGYEYLYNSLDIVEEILKKMLFNNVSSLIHHDKEIYYILKFDELAQYEDKNKIIDDKIDRLYKLIELNKSLDKNEEKDYKDYILSEESKEKDIQNRFVIIGYYLGLKLI